MIYPCRVTGEASPSGWYVFGTFPRIPLFVGFSVVVGNMTAIVSFGLSKESPSSPHSTDVAPSWTIGCCYNKQFDLSWVCLVDLERPIGKADRSLLGWGTRWKDLVLYQETRSSIRISSTRLLANQDLTLWLSCLFWIEQSYRSPG